ncbi:hypothetical protein Dsin_010388 [Dipteronia sinensis]|uniref:Type 2 DNA topoisomerase 6 subunit B-like n=1 Tax=Dipteronia sinensis TaxID=43782 RepID=A0AAE0ASE8_9ROSI|nr:hypothetical protein Dsin_010388 [Dipteronia sinensis]
MEVSSVQKLCIHLISAAFQRCRVSEDLCRLSVVLRCCSSAPDPSIVRISISDTGIGSSLEEFQDLKFGREIIDAEEWGKCLVFACISDDEIYHYHLNLRESISSRRLTRLPSNPKSGVKFRHAAMQFHLNSHLLIFRSFFFNYLLNLSVVGLKYNVAVELVVEREDVPGSQYKDVFLANECNPLPFSASNVERLKSGLEDYVLKHGNTLQGMCDSCFPSWEHLKVGHGVACCTETQRNSGMLMEVIIIISELSENSSCIRECGAKTEVLYFKDFTPCSINQICLTALTTVDWKSYGLALERVVDQGGCAILEWENLPPHVRIDMCKLPLLRQKTQPNQNLIKKAVKLALDDLKEKHAGVLLSAHAVKICSYAPDLARSIAGLILSSNDLEFQGECLTLLGLQSQHIDGETVESCIKEKIVSVIEMNDRKPRKNKEVAAPFLFEDDGLQELNLQDEEYDTGEHLLNSLDLF